MILRAWPDTKDDQRYVRLAFAALVVFALALRLACMTGLIGSDDLEYGRYAQAMLHGHFTETVNQTRGVRLIHWSLRYGVIGPVAAIYRVLGVSEWSTILLPLFASTASVLLLAQIGRRLFDWRVGLIAGALYATFPLQLRYATILVPEPVAELFALLGVLLYLRALEGPRSGPDAGSRRHALWYLAAGVAFGAAYLAKESAIFIGGAFLLHALWERRWSGLVLLGLGLFAVLAAEHTYYVVAHGDILFRPHATVLYSPQHSPNEDPNPNLLYRLLKSYPRRMLIPSVSYGLHSLACLIGAALALTLRPKRGYLLVLLWAIVPWLYLNFGSSSLTRYLVLPAQYRYIEFTYPPLMLLSGVVLARAFAARGRLAAVAATLLAVVCAVGVGSGLATRGRGWRSDEMAVLRAVAGRAARLPEHSVLATNRWWYDGLSVLDESLLSPSPGAATFVLRPDPLGLPVLEPIAQGARSSPTPATDPPEEDAGDSGDTP